jgi:Family of unknown function (DUF5681)
MPKDNGDYDVGYRKPPREYRFQEGQSGNPSGRKRKPKIDKSATDMLRAILAEKVTATINGKKQRMSLEEMALRKFVNQRVTSGDFYDLEHLKKHLGLRG